VGEPKIDCDVVRPAAEMRVRRHVLHPFAPVDDMPSIAQAGEILLGAT
jgi:hypothetical protein